MPKNKRRTVARDDREIVAPIFAFCGAAVGYFAAEALLRIYAHPFHWLTAALIAVLAYISVLIFYSYRARHRS